MSPLSTVTCRQKLLTCQGLRNSRTLLWKRGDSVVTGQGCRAASTMCFPVSMQVALAVGQGRDEDALEVVEDDVEPDEAVIEDGYQVVR